MAVEQAEPNASTNPPVATKATWLSNKISFQFIFTKQFWLVLLLGLECPFAHIELKLTLSYHLPEGKFWRFVSLKQTSSQPF